MEYILNEYHRNISDDDLIDDVKVVAERLGVSSLTATTYDKNGKYSKNTFFKRFGTWSEVLLKANLTLESQPYIPTLEEFCDDMKRLANDLCQESLTLKQYEKSGQYPSNHVYRYFKSWNEALKAVGLKETRDRKDISNEELLEEVGRLWIELARQPTSTDIKNNRSIFSLNTYARRFGGWRNTLLEFLKYVDTNKDDESMLLEQGEDLVSSLDKENEEVVAKRKTRRDINLQLRFKVLQRDSFKCCACGRSPALDSDVLLHVDHIKPWSKGGETMIENLQTLCSKCNLGKSDIE